MNLKEIGSKRDSLAAKYKWGLTALVALLVSPIIFLIVKGLVGLAIAAVVGIGIVNGLPVWSMRMANWRLKALKMEAMRAPIETMQNIYKKREKFLAEFKERITAYDTSTRTFSGKVDVFIQRYPNDAETYKRQRQLMQDKLASMRVKYQNGKAALVAYAETIEKAEAFYTMGLELIAANEASALLEENYEERMLVETSLNEVQNTLNEAFSAMESDMMDEVAPVLKAPAGAAPLQLTEGDDGIMVPVKVSELNKIPLKGTAK